MRPTPARPTPARSTLRDQFLSTLHNKHWTELLEWTTGLTFFVLKIIFISYNKGHLQSLNWTGGLTLQIIFMPSNETHLPLELHDASC